MISIYNNHAIAIWTIYGDMGIDIPIQQNTSSTPPSLQTLHTNILSTYGRDWTFLVYTKQYNRV